MDTRDEMRRKAEEIAKANREEMARLRAAREASRGPMVMCPGCGRMVAKSRMITASFATVCPDCYDDHS